MTHYIINALKANALKAHHIKAQRIKKQYHQLHHYLIPVILLASLLITIPGCMYISSAKDASSSAIFSNRRARIRSTSPVEIW